MLGKIRRCVPSLFFTILLVFTGQAIVRAAPGTLAQEPLITSSSVDANLMFLIDSSGSMLHIVVEDPYDPSVTYACPNNMILSPRNNYFVSLRVTSGSGRPYFSYDSYANPRFNPSEYDWGDSNPNRRGITGKVKKCFDPNRNYDAALYADDNHGNIKYASGYGVTLYPGNYLNWYFGQGSNSWGNSARNKPETQRRITVAQDQTKALVNTLSDIRVGVSKFNGSEGAHILVGIDDIDTNKSQLITAIDSIQAGGSTPLAEAMHELGRYFVQGYNNNLTMHPGKANQQSRRAYTIFNSTPRYSSGVRQRSPIEYFCQKSFIILLTDGRSTQDRDIAASTGLTDYDGDCQNAIPPCLSYDRKPATASDYSSDYLDDVAMAMFEMDLRPDLTDADGNEAKNNVVTYTIGFADRSVQGDPLLRETAAQSGGEFLNATDATSLADVFRAISAGIAAQVSSSSAISFNSINLSTDSAVYVASYNTDGWTGNIQKIPVNTDGSIGAVAWNANAILDAPNKATLFVFTYNRDTGLAVPFRTFTDLSAAMRADLNMGPSGSPDGLGQERVNYLRGDRSREDNPFRVRNYILSDIVAGGPTFVGEPESDWPDIAPFPTATGQTYSDFKNSSAKNRTQVVYASDNGGMLRGFRADNGTNVLNFIPSNLVSTSSNEGLHYLTNPAYQHRFYNDLQPQAQDAYVAARSGGVKWRTVLVGGQRAGGRGYFALDVTDPSRYTDANSNSVFMWEFSSIDDADLGFTYSQPVIGLMNNGRWAAIFGNGYNNTGSGRAKLFIVFLDGGLNGTWTLGQDYIVIDTRSGSSGNLNGLSSPAAVDLDGNGAIDRIYAGDLFGNMWAFDVSSANSNRWRSAYGRRPLFRAGSSQPITAKPIVIKHPTVGKQPSNEPNLLVLFGTGQFLTNNDKTTTSTQSFYGIWDEGRRNLNRNRLVQQTFTVNSNVRVMTDNVVDYNAANRGQKRYGWYIDLDPGERVINMASVRNDIVFFSTLIPDTTTVCSSGGSGFVMGVKTVNGGEPDEVIIDINNDSQLDDTDKLNNKVVSGVRFAQGMPMQPTIRGDYLFVPTSDGRVSVYKIFGNDGLLGRVSWQDLTNQP